MATLSIPHLRLAAAGVFQRFSIEETRLTSLKWRSIAPGGMCFPGWAVLGLGLLGILGGPPRRAARGQSVAMVLAGLVLAAGPYLAVSGVRISLPYAWLGSLVPGFPLVRFPARFFSLVLLGLACLVGLGLARIGSVIPVGQASR